MIIFNQLADGVDTGPYVIQWQQLRFVKYDYAVCDVMQFPALGRLIGIQRFEELYSCRNDDRHVPVFRAFHDGLFGLESLIKDMIGLVFQYRVLSENRPELLGGLVNNRRVRNDVDNPFHVLFDSMFQGESKGCQCLSAAGRDCHCEQSRHSGTADEPGLRLNFGSQVV